jgi:heptaprenyl diphosphate synthase
MRNRTRKLVFMALLVAMATALHVVEAMLLIPVPIPGVKLGLANIITLLTLYLYGFRAGLTVALMRVVLGSLICGMFLSPGFMLGLTGAIGSTLLMALLLKQTRCFSMIGISLAGATAHNTGQLLAACLLLQSTSIVYYLPVLLLAGIPTGFITGYLLNSLLEHNATSGILDDFVRT